jgi:hypothetical protein
MTVVPLTTVEEGDTLATATGGDCTGLVNEEILSPITAIVSLPMDDNTTNAIPNHTSLFISYYFDWVTVIITSDGWLILPKLSTTVRLNIMSVGPSTVGAVNVGVAVFGLSRAMGFPPNWLQE